MRTILLFLPILYITGLASPPSDESGGVVGNDWRLGAGMRASSMGQAFVAVSGDLWDLQSNPAGLAMMQHTTISVEALPMSMDRTLAAIAAGLVLPQNAGCAALSWRNASVTNNMGRDASANPTEPITDSDNLFSLGLGRSMADIFTVGFTIHAKYHVLANRSATGFAADLGMMLGSPELCLGGTIHNLVDRQRWDTQDLDPSGKSEKAPAIFVMGASGKPWHFLLLSSQYEVANGQTDRLRVGVEWQADNYVWVRGGYDNGDITLGGRVSIHSFAGSTLCLDYLWRTDEVGGQVAQGLGLSLVLP